MCPSPLQLSRDGHVWPASNNQLHSAENWTGAVILCGLLSRHHHRYLGGDQTTIRVLLAAHPWFGSVLLRAWTGRVTSEHVQTMKGKEQVKIPVCFNRTVLSSDSPETVAGMAFGASHCCQSPKKGLQELQLGWAVQLGAEMSQQQRLQVKSPTS